jgi:hypothetical protein
VLVHDVASVVPPKLPVRQRVHDERIAIHHFVAALVPEQERRSIHKSGVVVRGRRHLPRIQGQRSPAPLRILQLGP